MFLVDTGIWIDIFRDKTGERGRALRRLLDGQSPVFSRFIQLELLNGSRDEAEWEVLISYLANQEYKELSAHSWPEAARIYFDLRRRGRTVRSLLDCCIAQLAIEHDLLLLHRDRDFEAIAEIRPVRQLWLEWSS